MHIVLLDSDSVPGIIYGQTARLCSIRRVRIAVKEWRRVGPLCCVEIGSHGLYTARCGTGYRSLKYDIAPARTPRWGAVGKNLHNEFWLTAKWVEHLGGVANGLPIILRIASIALPNCYSAVRCIGLVA